MRDETQKEEQVNKEEVELTKKIEVGTRKDGSPYFSVTKSLEPMEALALTKWLDQSITDSISDLYGSGSGRISQELNRLSEEIRSLVLLMTKSHSQTLGALKSINDGIMQITGELISNLSEEETKDEI